MLSELLAAAVSGDSGLVVQGSAGTTEDHLRYGWNYALLLAEGPSERALVPSPVLTAMRGDGSCASRRSRASGSAGRPDLDPLGEVARDPELGSDRAVRAAPGFNLIGTANLRDRGVHEMSSALKRRFNFETVHPIADPAHERELVLKQLADRLGPAGVTVEVGADVAELLVQTFQDLRTGRTREGVSLSRPDAVMSTAEAVNVLHAAALEAAFLGPPLGIASRPPDPRRGSQGRARGRQALQSLCRSRGQGTRWPGQPVARLLPRRPRAASRVGRGGGSGAIRR